MARLGTKPPLSETTSDEAAKALDKLSKAALIDLYTHALSACHGMVGMAPDLEEIAADVRPMLRLRGDAEPAWLKRIDP